MSYFEDVTDAARAIDNAIEEGGFTLGEFLEALAFYVKFNEEHSEVES